MLNSSAVPAPAPGFTLEELDGALLLFEPDSGRIVHTNPTAALVWGLCDGRRTLAQIVALLTDAYPAQAGEVASDVPRVVDELLELGALRLRA